MGRDKNGTRNRELKELICTTHGHEPKVGGGVGSVGGLGDAGWRADKGREIGKTVIA